MLKRLIKTILFLGIGIILFVNIQKVLISDVNFTSQTMSIPETLYKDNVNADVLFIGTSHVANGISPMKIYEDSGIVSCNMGTSRQTIVISYYLLKEACTRHTPKIVILDASSLFFEDDGEDATWRDVMDNMDFSRTKLEFIHEYGKYDGGSGWITAAFPIIQYHSRWNQIGNNDFQKGSDKEYAIMQGVSSRVMGTNVSLESVNANADMVHKEKKYIISIDRNNNVTEIEEDSNLFPERISEHNIQYLQKIMDFCEEKNMKLLLTKIPTRTDYTTMGGAWTEVKYEMVKNLAAEKNIEYLDLIYENDPEINWLEDTTDYGAHLNIRGAEKVSAWFANYLINIEQVSAQNNSFFDEQLEKYKKLRTVATLQSEYKFDSYLQMLAENKEDWSVMMTVVYDGVGGLTDADYQLLDAMNLQLIRRVNPFNSYIAVIDKGQLKYEVFSDESVSYDGYLAGKSLHIYSSGSVEHASAVISFGGKEYTGNSGINFVVYDKESRIVIDSVVFQTYSGEKTAVRNGSTIYSALLDYKQYL